MAHRFARAALLLLVLPGWAVGIGKEGKNEAALSRKGKKEAGRLSTEEGLSKESSEKPRPFLSTAPSPLAPFGEPVARSSSKDGDHRTPSLLTMQVGDQEVHMYDSKHSFVKGGPPLNKNGATFDIHLKSQI